MKYIYIVLSHTGTILSRIIKLVTGNEYTHSSIALNESLETMYSFGRLNPYNPFLGGFVREGKSIGTFKRFKNTKVGVFKLEVTEKQYSELIENINYIEKNKEKFRFNILGMALAGIDKRIVKKNTFYCAEFVRYVLKKSGIKIDNLPKAIKPESFKEIENTKLIYKGLLRSYNRSSKDILEYIQELSKKRVSI